MVLWVIGSDFVKSLKSANSNLRGLFVFSNRGVLRCIIGVRVTREHAQSIKAIFFIVMSRMGCFSLFYLSNANTCMRYNKGLLKKKGLAVRQDLFSQPVLKIF